MSVTASDPFVLARAVAVGSHDLQGELGLPAHACALILFAQGSGVTLHSPCHDDVARALHAHGLATLMVELLHPQERRDRYKVFDVELLRERLESAFDWIEADPALARLPLGLFGSGLDAAAAVLTAGRHSDRVFALVSRQGRTELVRCALSSLGVPTLLISDDCDVTSISLDERALRDLRGDCRSAVVSPGAPTALPRYERVARLAENWFMEHLPPRASLAQAAAHGAERNGPGAPP
jgi:putative phosphoribosyl transferase